MTKTLRKKERKKERIRFTFNLGQNSEKWKSGNNDANVMWMWHTIIVEQNYFSCVTQFSYTS